MEKANIKYNGTSPKIRYAYEDNAKFFSIFLVVIIVLSENASFFQDSRISFQHKQIPFTQLFPKTQKHTIINTLYILFYIFLYFMVTLWARLDRRK